MSATMEFIMENPPVPLAFDAKTISGSSSDEDSDMEFQKFEMPETVPIVEANEDTPLYNTQEAAAIVRKCQAEQGRSLLFQQQSNNVIVEKEDSPSPIMAARAYQIEMFEKSLNANIIAMMDTGSGKTQIALLRIQRLLEDSKKVYFLVWFTAPTVALCMQQAQVIKSQISTASTRLLIGGEDIDSWSTSEIWEEALTGYQVIVSTPQMLSDALDHAFVQIGNLGLLIFDEVHNCVGNSPGSKIMRNHYHTAKVDGQPVPRILGLSASPSMNAAFKNAEVLEKLMDSTCCTPVIHREELLAHTARPRLEYLAFVQTDYAQLTELPDSYMMFHNALSRYNVNDDPFVIHMLSDSSRRGWERLKEIIDKRDTMTYKALRNISRRAETIYDKVGSWACQSYVATIMAKLRAVKPHLVKDPLQSREVKYLNHLLGDAEVPEPNIEHLNKESLAHKMQVLIDYLISVPNGTQGIIFADERTTVIAISEILAAHPEIIQRHSVKAVFGTALMNRTGVWDTSVQHPLNNNSLQDFRDKKVNILISTTVLEEGIDVPACNLVVCFDPPLDFKSFVQRRGRARSQKSSLVILVPDGEETRESWEDTEKHLRSMYEDEVRQSTRMAELEAEVEREEEDLSSQLFMVIPETGSRIDMSSAKGHLYHFCSFVGASDFVDSRPDFVFSEEDTQGVIYFRATIVLSPSLPLSLRVFHSQRSWRSQKNAAKDAALTACITLYHAGFLNKHFLPLSAKDLFNNIENRTNIINVRTTMSPWPKLAKLWDICKTPWSYQVTIRKSDGQLLCEPQFFSLPIYIDHFEDFPVYIDQETTWKVEIKHYDQDIDQKTLDSHDHTLPLVISAFGHRRIGHEKDRRCLVRFWSTGRKFSVENICSDELPLNDLQNGAPFDKILRDIELRPFLYHAYIPSKPPMEEVQICFKGYEEAPEGVPYLSVQAWTRRTDYTHKIKDPIRGPPTKKYRRVIPASWVKYDNVPIDFMHMGMLVPTLLHEVEMCLLTKFMNDSHFASLKIRDVGLLRSAICSRSATMRTDYERLEFLGDSMLKFMASLNISAEELDWPEGYLTLKKDGIVSNSRLCHLTLKCDLDSYLVTKSFTGRKWSPPFIEDNLNLHGPPQGRVVSTKTLADIIESLIGVAFIDGGIEKALCMLSILFKDEYKWMSEQHCRQQLYDHAPVGQSLGNLEKLEVLLDYTFTKKSLLIEAVTHASYIAGNSSSRSMDRLEFLGDSVLDRIIVGRLFFRKPELPNSKMHILKTALVNGDFLAWLCISHSMEFENANGLSTRYGIWDFIRKTSYPMGQVMIETQARYQMFRKQIDHELWHGKYYPWGLLCRLQAHKFYSDVFEAIIGAMYVDAGSIDPCAIFLERLGVFQLMDHLLGDGVEVVHPKERLSYKVSSDIVTYNVQKGQRGKGYTCQLFVGDVCWADVQNGVDVNEIKIEAAHQACINMELNTPLMATEVKLEDLHMHDS